MKNVNYVSNFTRLLAREGLFNNDPMIVVDAGARSGPQSHWPLYEKQIKVIGFEPYKEESDRLNAEVAAGNINVPFVCYPIGLGSENTTARLYEYGNKAANSMTPPVGDEAASYTDIVVRRFDEFATENGISKVDFMKIDVERHEVSVIEGLGKFLDKGGILGFEVEVHFQPQGDAPMLSDIELLLRKHGYRLYDVDIFRASSQLLPSPVAWDHRDHNNKPILGPTVTGPMVHGDALFIRDLAPEKEEILRTRNVTRVLKMASLFEVYGLPDCAVELLHEYRSILENVLPLDALLDSFVPNYYGEGMSYKRYLETYARYVGRLPNPDQALHKDEGVYLPSSMEAGGTDAKGPRVEFPSNVRVTLANDRPINITVVHSQDTLFNFCKRVVRRLLRPLRALRA